MLSAKMISKNNIYGLLYPYSNQTNNYATECHRLLLIYDVWKLGPENMLCVTNAIIPSNTQLRQCWD